jgi:hypothetical protein
MENLESINTYSRKYERPRIWNRDVLMAYGVERGCLKHLECRTGMHERPRLYNRDI